MNTLEREIQTVLNRYSAENESNTPDFILAQYLIGCLSAWNTAVQQREKWYGRDARPTEGLLTHLGVSSSLDVSAEEEQK